MTHEKSIEDWENHLKSIIELMGNPYCDHLMFMSLLGKRAIAKKNIERLKNKAN